MEDKRFNLVLNQEQIEYILFAIECYLDNEEQIEDPNEKSIDVLKKIENRLRKNY
jgi:hypothetical protein